MREVLVVPGNGCFSSLGSELDGDSIVDSVDPAVKCSGDDKFDYFLVLLF